MSKLILPFSPDTLCYQLIELELTNGKRVLAVAPEFINEEKTKQLLVRKFLVHPPNEIPSSARDVFKPFFNILKDSVQRIK